MYGFLFAPSRRPRSRDYELERKRLTGQLEETTEHPLQALVTVSAHTHSMHLLYTKFTKLFVCCVFAQTFLVIM